MFEQHPVPQQISSYQFRLVGDMTLKQFFQLAAGAILGLIVYATGLPSIFKWPLIIFFVVMGAAFAFLPLQERPLEEWLAAFFRAAYGPTLFKWEKPKNIQYFAPGANTSVTSVASPLISQQPNSPVAKLEIKENSFLTNITNMFSLHPKQATPVQAPAVDPLPSLTVPVKPVNVQTTPMQPLATGTIHIDKIQSTQPQSVTPQQPKPGTLFVATPPVQPIATARAGYTQAAVTPEVKPIETTNVAQTLQQNGPTTGIAVQFSPDAAPPTPATIPNVIVGQVMDSQGKIVEGAILEVTDFQGRPVRALKTNKAGHFMTVTPLPNGSYQLNVEKEGLTFDTVNFDVHGVIVPPMALKAKAV